MLGLIGLAIAAYVSTNIDDLLLLIGFFAHPDYRADKIICGQFIGIGVLIGVSFLCALATVAIPLAYIGLLGLAPIYLGCSRFLTRFDLTHRPPALPGHRQILAVIAATVADGGDNVATYVPILAANSRSQNLVVVLLFALLTAVWCWLARIMVGHPTTGRVFRAWSVRGLPILLIIVGLFVLWRNGSFGLL